MVHTPSTLLSLLLNFRSCFTAPGFDNFVLLVTGWISCQGRHSVARVIQAGFGKARKKHHSSIYRFFSRGTWIVDQMSRALLSCVLPLTGKTVYTIVDDTLCEKSGPHYFGAGMHYDARKSSYGRRAPGGKTTYFAFGHSWVVLSIWVPLDWHRSGGLAIPVLFRLYCSKKLRPKGLKHRKRTDLAVELVRILESWLPEGQTLHLLGDSEYACQTILRDLPALTEFTGPMHMKAALFGQPGPRTGKGRPRKKGQRLQSPEQLAAEQSVQWRELPLRLYGTDTMLLVKSQTCLWYRVTGTRLVRMVVTRDPKGRISDRAYFTTDLNASVGELLIRFARRWELEVAFRNTKQLMGIEDPQNGWWRRDSDSLAQPKKAGPNPRGRRGQEAVERTAPLAFVAYGITILWYLKHGDVQQSVEEVRAEAPWYRHKSTASFADMIAALRRELWRARILATPVLEPHCDKILDLFTHAMRAA